MYSCIMSSLKGICVCVKQHISFNLVSMLLGVSPEAVEGLYILIVLVAGLRELCFPTSYSSMCSR